MKTKIQNIGFSLIEVLVALFIFAVALLGLTSLQLAALRASNLATELSQSTIHLHNQAELQLTEDQHVKQTR